MESKLGVRCGGNHGFSIVVLPKDLKIYIGFVFLITNLKLFVDVIGFLLLLLREAKPELESKVYKMIKTDVFSF